MDTFAFIIHPIDPKRDVSRKFPLLGRLLNERQIDYFSTYFPPLYISEIEGITSAATGKQIKGWFVACPLTPTRMLTLPITTVYQKIIRTGRMAEELGARILGLGAFTSVVGDAGLTISRALGIPVTTGDSYTAWTAVEAVREAARLLEIPLGSASAAVVGATGVIGRVCAELLADQVDQLHLIGRNLGDLEKLRHQLHSQDCRAHLAVSTTLNRLAETQLILTVTSSLHALIQPESLQPGSVICDMARPRDVSAGLAAVRDDVLVIDGGMVSMPGPVDFHFDFGFPPGKAYACMAETMALALEGRYESFSLGKGITRAQVEAIAAITSRHGFQLSGFRSFGQPVTPDQIETLRAHARRGRVTT